MVAYWLMFPVIFSAGAISVSSLGVFLVAGFLVGIFLVWRLARAWDLSEEKILDLIILTVLGGLFFARTFFILGNIEHLAFSPLKWVDIIHYPGFSFWAGFLAGASILSFMVKRSKLDLWQIADIAAVGLLGGLIFADLGCFLGGCAIGVKSSLFFAVPVAGVVGKRFPVQFIEALLLSFSLIKIWSAANHFHQRGKIIGLTLLYLGLIKIAFEPLKEIHGIGFFINFALVLLGIQIIYRVTRRNIKSDLRAFLLFIPRLFIDGYFRKKVIGNLKRSWYNQVTSFLWKLRNTKKFLRRLNVKFS